MLFKKLTNYYRKAFNPFGSENSHQNSTKYNPFQGAQNFLDSTVAVPYEYSPVQLQPSTPLTSVCFFIFLLKLFEII